MGYIAQGEPRIFGQLSYHRLPEDLLGGGATGGEKSAPVGGVEEGVGTVGVIVEDLQLLIRVIVPNVVAHVDVNVLSLQSVEACHVIAAALGRNAVAANKIVCLSVGALSAMIAERDFVL